MKILRAAGITLCLLPPACGTAFSTDLPDIPEGLHSQYRGGSSDIAHSQIVIPKLWFKDATLPDIAAFLQSESSKYDPTHAGFQFVVLTPGNFGEPEPLHIQRITARTLMVVMLTEFERQSIRRITCDQVLKNVPLMEGSMFVAQLFEQRMEFAGHTIFFMPPFLEPSTGPRYLKYSIQKLRIRGETAQFQFTVMDQGGDGKIVGYRWCEMVVSLKTGETLKIKWKPLSVAKALALVQKYNDELKKAE